MHKLTHPFTNAHTHTHTPLNVCGAHKKMLQSVKPISVFSLQPTSPFSAQGQRKGGRGGETGEKVMKRLTDKKRDMKF